MSPFLAVEHLSCGYNGKSVVSDISFSVNAGDRWAIIGPNGSGKSTLLKTVAGLLAPLGGGIILEGQSFEHLSHRFRARKIAFVPQPTGRTFPPFTVLRFVTLARHPWHGPFDNATPNDVSAVAQALAITDAACLSHRRLTELSGGEVQRVLLAAAVAQETPLILLDEPESFLDPCHVMMMRSALSRIHDEKGTSIISVLHDVDAAITNHSHILALKSGESPFSGPASELSVDMLKRIYGVSFEPARGMNSGRTIMIMEDRT